MIFIHLFIILSFIIFFDASGDEQLGMMVQASILVINSFRLVQVFQSTAQGPTWTGCNGGGDTIALCCSISGPTHWTKPVGSGLCKGCDGWRTPSHVRGFKTLVSKKDRPDQRSQKLSWATCSSLLEHC